MTLTLHEANAGETETLTVNYDKTAVTSRVNNFVAVYNQLQTLVTKVLGTRFEREQKKMRPIVQAIHEHEERLTSLPDEAIKGPDGQTGKFRKLIAERTGALEAEVKRLKQAKHDAPDAADRQRLDADLRMAEQRYAAELRRTLDATHLTPAAEAAELYAFADYGRAYDRSEARDEDQWESLGSVGIGARIDIRDWLSISPEIARQTDGVPTDTTDPDLETRFYLGATARF